MKERKSYITAIYQAHGCGTRWPVYVLSAGSAGFRIRPMWAGWGNATMTATGSELTPSWFEVDEQDEERWRGLWNDLNGGE